MALSIKNPKVDRLARKLAEVTGENMTEAISKALEERLQRETGHINKHQFREEIQRIQNRVNRLSRLDKRSDEEILGYDKRGLPA